MNYLELCQKVNEECGITGANQPTSVSNQSSILLHIVNWVRTADYTIQNLYFDWRFLWGNNTQTIVEDAFSIVPISNFKHIDPESIYIIDGTDRTPIDVIDYKQLRSIKNLSQKVKPYVCAISPDNQIVFPVTSDKIYTIEYDYYKKPVFLTDNTDTSLIPEEYHRCIVLLAKLYYSERFSVPEVAQAANGQYQEIFDRLRSDQLPGLNNMRTVQSKPMMVVTE